MALFSRPSDIVTTEPTWSVTSGANAAAYPLANLFDLRPWKVARSTSTSITYRATFGAPQALQAIAFINTNATAIQVTNGAGINQAVTIAATPADGLNLDPWLDLRGLANTSSTQWTFALTGPSGVALGLPILAETLRALEILWSPAPVDSEAHPTMVHRTDYGVKLKWGFGTRERGLRGSVMGETARADLLALERDAGGLLRSFLLIPEDEANDARYVDLATDLREFMYVAPASTDGEYVHSIPLAFDEQQKGWL